MCISPKEVDLKNLIGLKKENKFVSTSLPILDLFFENINGYSILQKKSNLKNVFSNGKNSNEYIGTVFFQYLNSVMDNYPSKDVIFSLMDNCESKWKLNEIEFSEYLPFDMTYNPTDKTNKNVFDPYCLSEYVLNGKNVDKKYEIHRTMLRKLGFITRNTDTISKYTIEEQDKKIEKCLTAQLLKEC